MRYLAVALVCAYVVNFLVAAREARRYRLPVKAVLRAQMAAFRRSLAPVVWLGLAAPIVVSVSGIADPLRRSNLVSLALYYGLCIVALWLVSAWPFNSPRQPPG